MENKPKSITSRKWMCLEIEPVWDNKVVHEALTNALDNCFRQADFLPLGERSAEETRAGISSPLRQISVSEEEHRSLKQAQLTTNDYVQGELGFYTTLTGLSTSRRCVQRVKKANFPVSILLLDNLIILVNVHKHWF